MKKKLLIGIALILVLVGVYGIYSLYSKNVAADDQQAMCLASDAGWAPYFSQTDCSGNPLDASSDLVFGEYTCWCHQPNTCWDGTACVSRDQE